MINKGAKQLKGGRAGASVSQNGVTTTRPRLLEVAVVTARRVGAHRNTPTDGIDHALPYSSTHMAVHTAVVDMGMSRGRIRTNEREKRYSALLQNKTKQLVENEI